MYSYEIQKSLQKILKKLSKKDKDSYEKVLKKIEEILQSSNVEHYKNLQYNLSDRKRVHIGHFVLVFTFNKTENKIVFIDYDPHDNIYRKK